MLLLELLLSSVALLWSRVLLLEDNAPILSSPDAGGLMAILLLLVPKVAAIVPPNVQKDADADVVEVFIFLQLSLLE